MNLKILFLIGLMDNGRFYCKALKYKNEPTGLCCANGKNNFW